MILEKITLLSLEEYTKNEKIIPVIEEYWWLRTPGDNFNACYVYPNGNADACGFHVYLETISVRPALKLNLEFDDPLYWHRTKTLVGAKIKYGKYTWTILNTKNGELYALCDEVISKHYFDEETNIWEESELKHWLETEGLKLITT